MVSAQSSLVVWEGIKCFKELKHNVGINWLLSRVLY